MLILKQALGSLTAHQSEARPAAVAESEDGGSWAERAFRHRLWRRIVNSAGHFATSSDSELTTIYSNLANPADFQDIAIDYCGPFAGLSGKAGWDFCTGVGSIQGKAGK